MLLRPPHSKLCLMSWPHVYLFFNVAFSLFTVTRLFPAWPWVWIVQLASMHTGAWLVSHRGQLVKGSRRSCHTAEINKFQGKEGPVGCHFWKLPFQVGFKVPLAEVLFFSIIDPLAINSWVLLPSNDCSIKKNAINPTVHVHLNLLHGSKYQYPIHYWRGWGIKILYYDQASCNARPGQTDTSFDLRTLASPLASTKKEEVATCKDPVFLMELSLFNQKLKFFFNRVTKNT